MTTMHSATAHGAAPHSAHDAAPDRLHAILRDDGLHALLAALNGRTRYRFTGIYRVAPPLLRNVALFDRENPTLALGGDINTLDETFCALVAASGRPFTTADAPLDPRLRGHAARAGVQSYLGVPLRSGDGRVWGTLCHFDPRPRLAPHGEDGVLAQAAMLLASRLQALS